MQNNNSSDSTASFIEAVVGDDAFRVEEDLGCGYVKLRTSEAEKRQAAQDIRSSEDVVIELLRNSRDAGAKNIFVALHKESNERKIVIIDDGCGVPDAMRTKIFEPRVTSKLDTAHLDKWGMHGRGMALYSIFVNSNEAQVVYSVEGSGTSISVITDTSELPEKIDQSTFPHFEKSEDSVLMRGPKNIVRTVAEFSLEHKMLNVYCGSFTEIAATMYMYGTHTVSPAMRAFKTSLDSVKLDQRLAFAADPEDFAVLADQLGLNISERSARRIMDGTIKPIDSILDRIKQRFEEHGNISAVNANSTSKKTRSRKGLPVSISKEDMQMFSGSVKQCFQELANAYFLEGDIQPRAKLRGDTLTIELPILRKD